MTTKHPDYAILAARIAISNLHKETKKSFSQVMSDLYHYGESRAPHISCAYPSKKCCLRLSQPQERPSIRHDLEGDL